MVAAEELLGVEAVGAGASWSEVRSEATRKTMGTWPHENQGQLALSRAGRTTESRFIESIDGHLRGGCRSELPALSRADMTCEPATYWRDTNYQRPHSEVS